MPRAADASASFILSTYSTQKDPQKANFLAAFALAPLASQGAGALFKKALSYYIERERGDFGSAPLAPVSTNQGLNYLRDEEKSG